MTKKKTKISDYPESNLGDYNEDEADKRMNIIGQNGNDGLHYGEEADGTGYVTYTKYPGDIKVTYEIVKKDGTKKSKKPN